jgi:uncharacterized protein YqjF (DUF2071 family)
MNAANTAVQRSSTPSDAAKQRLLSQWGEPLFLADWREVLMMHFEVDADALQRDISYELDLRDGRAYVSVVAFTMHGMRPRFGGRLGAWLFRPIAAHHFLNVRTYVRHDNERGIHFITEWLSNRLAVALGPRTFGLPYRYGHIRYQNDWRYRNSSGRVVDARTGDSFRYQATLTTSQFTPCEQGTLDEWLMEHYIAFTGHPSNPSLQILVPGGTRICTDRKFFRVWHLPWLQGTAQVLRLEKALLEKNWAWFNDARLVGANYSPGVRDVWMGRPHTIH